MLYYADKVRETDSGETRYRILQALREAAEQFRISRSPRATALVVHPELAGAAIQLGELHQAHSDLRNPIQDEVFPETDRLAEAAILLGRCLFRTSALVDGKVTGTGAGLVDLLQATRAAVGSATSGLWAGPQLVKVPEGFALYCLYPEMYLASAKRATAGLSPGQPFTVIGIRSIGTTLAPLVAGALIELGFQARVETVRPRGHPFHRYAELSTALRKRLAEEAVGGARFVLVDEGPGLTCSSFLSVCDCLGSLGISEEQLLILSAWRGAPSIYASEEGRERWKRLRVVHTEAADAFDRWRTMKSFVHQSIDPSQEGASKGNAASPDGVRDISYGRWRDLMYPSPDRWPVVHRSTERVKLLFPLAGQTVMGKFAGLGRYGHEKFQRATILAGAGFSPPALGLAYGFLLHPFMEDACPLSADDLSPDILNRLADYYAFVARRFSRPPTPSFDQLAEVLQLNARESIGVDASGFVEYWMRFKPAIDDLPLCLLDGKPQPHEWIRTSSPYPGELLKTDQWDHCEDHTFVGAQNIAWDLAGACEEWQMREEEASFFINSWVRAGGDPRSADVVPFYRAAYLAFRVAELHYAIHSTDEVDVRQSLQHEQWRYGQRLAAVLSIHAPSDPSSSDLVRVR